MRKFILTFLCILCVASYATAQEAPESIPVGELKVFMLPDADLELTPQLIPDLDKYPEYKGIFTQGSAPGVNRTFYLDNADHKILFDTGWGSESAKQGHTLENLHRMGVAPEDITDIVLTHMDMDHIGGLIKNKQKVFPNATLWISQPEAEAWQSGEGIRRSPEAIARARDVLKTYADKIKTFAFGSQILPNITALDASGHTPGHTAYDISASDGSKLTIAGDLLHLYRMQLPLPAVNSVYDMDGEKAAASREKLLARAAQDHALMAGMHLPLVGPVIARPDGGFAMREPR